MGGTYPGGQYRGGRPGFHRPTLLVLIDIKRPIPSTVPQIGSRYEVGAFPVQAAKYLRLLNILRFGGIGAGLSVINEGLGLVPWFHPPYNYSLEQCNGGFFVQNSSGSVRACEAVFAIGSMVPQVWGTSASIDTYGPPLSFPFGNPSLRKKARYLRILGPDWPSLPYSPRHFLPQENPNPETWPNVDPMKNPIRQPSPNPHPLPWVSLPWRTNPKGRNPDYAPHATTRGYAESPDPVPAFGYGRVPPIDVGTGGGPPPPPRPPPRDRKVRMSGALLAGWRYTNRAINAVTEANDFVGAIWKALPYQYQTRTPGRATSPWEMLQDLLNHWGRINPSQAVLNLIREFGGDLAFGGLSSALSQTYLDNPYFQRPIGWQTGLVF